MTTYTGKSILRLEDDRLLHGRGQYVDDLREPGMLHVAFVRSTEAHAGIASVETGAARARPGIADVVTGQALEGVVRRMPVMRRPNVPSKPGGEQPMLAVGRVRYVGQPVAAVVAESRAAAEDAAALVEVRYEPLPAVVDVREAIAPGAPVLHDEMGDNAAMRNTVAGGDVDAAFERADVVVQQDFWVPRIAPAPMECRGVLARYDQESNTLTVWSSTQSPHESRAQLGMVLGEGAPSIRVIAPDVGGGFGQKHHLYPDEALTAWLAWRLRRPVKWIEGRGDNFCAEQSRGMLASFEVAADSGGRILGVRGRLVADVGAYQEWTSFVCPDLASKRVVGPYAVDDVRIDLAAVMTNKPPTGPYRGAGQPEVSYAMERLVDLLAARLDLDPADVRRRNLLRADQLPHTTYADLRYDTGDYPALLDRALALAEYDAWRAEQSTRRDGRLLGVGVASVTTGSGGSAGTMRSSYARVAIDRYGAVTVDSDVSPHGQGIPTSFAQLVADQLGVDPARVAVRTGDTMLSKPAGPGSGTYASRSMVIGGSAAFEAAQTARAQLVEAAAHAFECATEDVVLEGGRVTNTANPSQRMGVGELAVLAGNGAFAVEHTYTMPTASFAGAVHVAVVEVDPLDGSVDVLRYVAVHDCGMTVNPLIVRAQIVGGIVQGLGEALFEHVSHDAAGRPSAMSLMDYGVPQAGDLPPFTVELVDVPSALTPTGTRGVGESPAVAAPAALSNAVHDALLNLGVRELGMPLTPARVWAGVQAASA